MKEMIGKSGSFVRMEIAVWHSVLNSAEIARLLGMKGRISWSAGDLNEGSSTARKESYFRSIEQKIKMPLWAGLSETILRLKLLTNDSEYRNGMSRIALYFYKPNDLAELSVSAEVIHNLSNFDCSIVIR